MVGYRQLPVDVRLLESFTILAEELNFTRAAEECNVAQPSLTRAVQKLEEELGGLLLHRERQHTHVTELGRMMLPHLERTFAAAQAAKELARGVRKGETAAAVPTTVARSLWPRTLTRRTQKPVSSLWKVTRSTAPVRRSVG